MANAHVIAGDCTATYSGDHFSEKQGRVVCVRKLDDTVLVHDSLSYRPSAWLTRADVAAVAVDPPTVEARDGDDRLRVLFRKVTADVRLPVSTAGEPSGRCPGDASTLVCRSGRCPPLTAIANRTLGGCRPLQRAVRLRTPPRRSDPRQAVLGLRRP